MDLKSIANLVNPLLLYPTGATFEQAERCAEVMGEQGCDPDHLFWSFSQRIQTETVEGLEENYINTFDMTRDTTLDIGWLLFGEDYNRGTFLVRMRNYLKMFDLPETVELPDHLTHVLSIMGCMEEEEALDFATACVIPAVQKCVNALHEETPYRILVRGVYALLENRCGVAREDQGDE